MVYRVYVEKKKELANEAKSLFNDIKTFLGIDGITDVRLVNCYDAENIDEELFNYCKKTVFSEPQLDIATESVDFGNAVVFAVEYLPGQFDQRADSAAQCYPAYFTAGQTSYQNNEGLCTLRKSFRRGY